MRLTSSVFENGGSIPAEHTCEGHDRSPPLHFHDVPQAAKSLALILVDPDAPDPKAPKRIWVHWVLCNLPSNASMLSEGGDDFPGAIQGLNDFGRTGYGGPCPPIGRHRYFFKLYALDTIITHLETPTRTDLEQAMEGHIVAHTELMGTYQKRK